MLGDALSYLKNSDDWIPTVIIGGVLTLLSIFVLPVVIVQGYLVRVLESAAKGERAAPSFTDWGGLVVDGLKLLVVNLAYALVVVVPFFGLAVVLGVVGSLTSPSGDPSAAVGATFLLGSLVLALFGLVVGYFAPAGFANFAVEGSLGAAFDISTIASAATTGEYFKAWVLAALVGLVLGAIGSLLSPVLVGFLVLFYVQVAMYYLYGRGFAEGLSKKRRGVVESSV
ncbi:DUF4013 domain-containing protein [Halogeometricum luteum]|uniref:DUF4013 domain-containing protein n=1 Tax=Halogeometricum luteum TaxID=2950537 RepID=A0ABU2G3E4_9EURY|nr:DUF4013 domain-containing protein [Halogeometricum sp. S3BR5-2]MDS0294829.1 DUF4013 domain-containing protein [Halogeometricum sp. S3BR5-2]